jgi:hypothetical protein
MLWFRNRKLEIYLPSGRNEYYQACNRHVRCSIHICKPVTTATLALLFSLPLFTDLNVRLGRAWGVGAMYLGGDGRIIGSPTGKTFLPLTNACCALRVRFHYGLAYPQRSIHDDHGIVETLKQICASAFPLGARVRCPMLEERPVQSETFTRASSVTVHQLSLYLVINMTEEVFRGVFTVVSLHIQTITDTRRKALTKVPPRLHS